MLCLWGGTAYALTWPFHVSFGCGRTGIEILEFNVSDKFGHPFKKPVLVAFRGLDILGLHKDWWANSTLFACVKME